MNIDIVDDLEKTLNFLKNLIMQLNTYNSISTDNLKLLCYIVYKQNTVKKEKEIEHFLLTALSFINQDTKVYINERKEVKDTEQIFNNYINTNFKNIFGD